MGNELKLMPCPFCGKSQHKQYAIKAGLDVGYVVSCTYCGGRAEGRIPEEAVDQWNKRAQPAEQHQGRPTGLSQGWNLTRQHDGFVIGHSSREPLDKHKQQAMKDGYVYVPFMVEQHQGEPYGCMMYPVGRRDEEFFTFGVPDVSKPDARGEMWEVIPLYTHADPGEVERLRDELRVIRSSCPDDCEVSGSIAGTAQNYIGRLEQERDTLRDENDRLRRFSLDLRNCNFQGYNADGSGPIVYAERTDGLRDIVGIKMHGWYCSGPRDTLSASAEPSAPVEDDYLPEGIVEAAIHGQIISLPSAPVELDELTDEQIIEAMRSYLNDADGGYVVDTAPDDVVKAGRALLACARRGAPVEIDERALIELALSEYGKATGNHVLPGGFNDKQDAFAQGFLCCAALERKP